MNRYTIVCRLRWPAFILLTGVIALLDQMGVVGWGRAWPLYLILWGVLALAERAAMAAQPPVAAYDPNPGYAPGYPAGYAHPPGAYTGPYPNPAASINPVQAPPYQPVTPASKSIVPASSEREISSIDSERQPRKSWEEEGR
jgi:hypothetical protein